MLNYLSIPLLLTKSDTVAVPVLPQYQAGLYCVGAGNLNIICPDNTEVTIAVADKTFVPFPVVYLKAATTVTQVYVLSKYSG